MSKYIEQYFVELTLFITGYSIYLKFCPSTQTIETSLPYSFVSDLSFMSER